jgi:DNA-binding IclR family transcriptional regulator
MATAVKMTNYRAPALEKGLDILELLAKSASGLSATQIAQTLGRSLSEIYRVTLALESRGYIRKSPTTECYGLTLRLFELAHEFPPINRLVAVALPEMEKLAASAEQSCHMVILNGKNVLVVAQIDAPTAMRYSVRLGAQFPIAETSSGAVLLAYTQDEEKEAILRDIRVDTPELAANIDTRIAAVLERGCERTESLVVEGVLNISYPVFDYRGVVAALTVPYLKQIGSPSIDMAEQLLQEHSLRISRLLGFRPADEQASKTWNGGTVI